MNLREDSARLSISVWKRLLPYLKGVKRHLSRDGAAGSPPRVVSLSRHGLP